MNKNLSKYIIKNLISKYSQKLFDHAQQSATNARKTASKAASQKVAEAAADLNSNEIALEITSLKKFNTE